MENTVGDYQNGFQNGISTTEQIFNIRQIWEKTKEFGIDTHYLFIDFKTAYDSINRKVLIAAMKEFKISDKLLGQLGLALSETKIVVKVPVVGPIGNKKWSSTRRCIGVSSLKSSIRKSGMRFHNIHIRGNIFNKSIQLLVFANDIDIIARTPTALRQAFLSLEKVALRMGLKFNENRPSTCLALNHVLTIPILKLKSIVLTLLTASLI
ncbi:putative endonuclease-reverse transcriptase [Trichonephila clavipes]|nr:putative endonuclease-reverse transcriptase [Trichonephila clavipes]